MERFNNADSSSDRASNFGDRRTSRQETRRGSRPSSTGQTSSRRRIGSPNSPQTSSSRLNSENSTRPAPGSNGPSKTNNRIEDAAFFSSEKGVRGASRRPSNNSGAKPVNQRPSSKSSYSSSRRKSRPRDNSSRFDD